MKEYIEREAVLRRMQKIATEAWKMRIKANVETVWNEAQDVLRFFPAADVRPVVRGKWIPYYEDFDDYDGGVEKRQWGFECSLCGRWEENAEPFCNCGAMMEES